MAEATVAVEQVAMGVVEARAVVGEGSPLQPLPCRRRLHHPQRPKRMPPSPPPPPLHPWPMSPWMPPARCGRVFAHARRFGRPLS